MQRSWNEKKFSRRKIDIGAAERAGQAENNCEPSGWSDLARRIKIPFLDFEQSISNEQLAFWLNQTRRGVVEIDRLQRFIDM